MSAVMEATPVVVRTKPRREWTAVFALARFEARKLLLRIPVLFALAVYLGWIVWRGQRDWGGYPALQDVDRATQNGSMLVGLAVLLYANQAALRSRRHDTERHFGVLVVPLWRRTAGHALSVVPAALLVAVCVAGQFTWEALQPGAVGSGSPGELLVGPLTVLLFGAVGVLLARLVSSVVAAPLLLVFFLLVFVLGASPTFSDGWSRWLYPVVGEGTSNTLPSDLIGRPAAWHALYLAGLALTVALLAVLAGGGRGWAVRASVAGALALTVLGASGQAGGDSSALTAARVRASTAPEKEQTCLERGRSQYCAFPEWTPRAGTWADVVDHVQSLAGGTAHERKLLVRQRIEARYGLTGDSAMPPATAPGQVTVGTQWGGNRVPEFSVAVASVLVAGDEKAGSSMCDGRMVTVMWLGLAWQSDPVAELRNVRLDDSAAGSAVVVSQTEPLSMTAGQTSVVRELLDRPQEAVAAKVKAHWAELTAPGVKTARVAEVLGVARPEEADKCGE
jgi:hypothetical protein